LVGPAARAGDFDFPLMVSASLRCQPLLLRLLLRNRHRLLQSRGTFGRTCISS
jgi:hypothetical protein